MWDNANLILVLISISLFISIYLNFNFIAILLVFPIIKFLYNYQQNNIEWQKVIESDVRQENAI